MPADKLIVVPIYWGASWARSTDPRLQPLHMDQAIDSINVDAALWTIMRSWYMLGLEEYGVVPGAVHQSLIISDPEPPKTFADDPASVCWTKVDDVKQAGLVPGPEAWGDGYKVFYMLFFEPGCAMKDPNVFGENHPGQQRAWVTANSDLAGVIETYAHEMVEGVSGQQIGDPCQSNNIQPDQGLSRVEIDGLRLPTYFSNTLNMCWPTQEAINLHRGPLPFSRFKEAAKNPVKISDQ